jgi:hypothetical protein
LPTRIGSSNFGGGGTGSVYANTGSGEMVRYLGEDRGEILFNDAIPGDFDSFTRINRKRREEFQSFDQNLLDALDQSRQKNDWIAF